MILFFIGIIMGGLGVFVFSKADYAGFLETCGILISGVGFMISAISLFFLIVNPVCVKSNIQEFNSVKQTIDAARADNAPIESAAMQHKVVDANKWLASTKYYNSIVFFDDFIPDEVEDLEPIK